MSLNSLQMPIPIPIPMACKPFNIQWFTRNGIGIGIGSGNGIGICKLFKLILEGVSDIDFLKNMIFGHYIN